MVMSSSCLWIVRSCIVFCILEIVLSFKDKLVRSECRDRVVADSEGSDKEITSICAWARNCLFRISLSEQRIALLLASDNLIFFSFLVNGLFIILSLLYTFSLSSVRVLKRKKNKDNLENRIIHDDKMHLSKLEGIYWMEFQLHSWAESTSEEGTDGRSFVCMSVCPMSRTLLPTYVLLRYCDILFFLSTVLYGVTKVKTLQMHYHNFISIWWTNYGFHSMSWWTKRSTVVHNH